MASPASQLHQFGSSLAAVSQLSHQYRLLDYGRNHLYNYRSPGCLLCSQRRGKLGQPLPKGASSCSTVWHLGRVMLIPHLKQLGQGHTTTTQPRAPGQRTSRSQSTAVPCSILVTSSVPSAVPGEGRGRTPAPGQAGGESMTQSVPPLPAMQWK